MSGNFCTSAIADKIYRAGGLLVALATLLFVGVAPVYAFGPWDEGFEDYSLGSINGQDGWISTTGNHIQITNDTYGKAASCANVTCAAEKGSLPSLNSYGQVTISFLVKATSFSTALTNDIQIKTTNDTRVCMAGLNDTSGPQLVADLDGNTGASGGAGTLSLNTWYEMNLRIDFDSQQCTLVLPSQALTIGPVDFDNVATSTTRLQLALRNSVVDAITFEDGIEGGVQIPPDTENYIVILEPQSGDRDVSYNANVYLQMNCPDCTGTTSYKLEFFNQVDNYDYSSLTQCLTTTDNTLYQTIVPIQFVQDDIIYARAHYYDNSSCDRGTNGEDYLDGHGDISFWVSANGNPSEDVDLGVFRSTSSSTCAGVTGFSATSTSWYEPVAFANAGCEVAKFLFVPSEGSLQYIKSLSATATATAPFSYIYDVRLYYETMFTVTPVSWSITLASSTPVFGGMTLISSAQVDSNSNYQLVKAFFTVLMYIGLTTYVIFRLRAIVRSL